MLNGNPTEQNTPALRQYRSTVLSNVVRREARPALTIEQYLAGEPNPEPGADRCVWERKRCVAVLRVNGCEVQTVRLDV